MGALVLGDLVRTLLLEAASLSESPSRQVPRCPRRRSSPSSGSRTAYIGVLGSPPILPCSSEVRPSALGAAGPCRTIRSVMRG